MLASHRVQLGSCVDAEVGVLWEVLAEQAVTILVAAALPRTVWVTEEDRDLGINGELRVLGHFFPLVPGERPAKLRGELGQLTGERTAHVFGGGRGVESRFSIAYRLSW